MNTLNNSSPCMRTDLFKMNSIFKKEPKSTLEIDYMYTVIGK